MMKKMELEALVVDDNPWWLRMLTRLTSEAGYTVLKAQTYATALQTAEEIAPDLVVTDIRLKDSDESNVDGLRLLKTLYERGQLKASIVITGYGDSEKRETAVQLGALYFEKGDFTRKDFQRALAQVKQNSLDTQSQRLQARESQKTPTSTDRLKRLLQVSYLQKVDPITCT